MIPLFKPYMPDLPELDSILASGQLSYGMYTKKFEEQLQSYFETPYVMAVNTFSFAVSVAVTALGLAAGDEVIASPMACLVSTQPYLSNGLKIKWCDIDSKKGTLDPIALSKCITKKTKAIIHNHFCGYPGYIDEVNAIGKEYGIPVIDDGIECFGSEYKGRKIGNCGTDVAIFSFSAVRIPNTIEGGAIIFKDKNLYETALRLRDSGIDRNLFRDEIGEISPDCDIKEVGFSATMSNVNGYIGLEQTRMMDQLLKKQRDNAALFDKFFRNQMHMECVSASDALPNYWVYGVLADNKRQAIMDFRNVGLYASGVHMNNNRYTVFEDKTDLSGVNEFYNHFVAIPCGWWMEAKEWIDNYKN